MTGGQELQIRVASFCFLKLQLSVTVCGIERVYFLFVVVGRL